MTSRTWWERTRGCCGTLEIFQVEQSLGEEEEKEEFGCWKSQVSSPFLIARQKLGTLSTHKFRASRSSKMSHICPESVLHCQKNVGGISWSSKRYIWSGATARLSRLRPASSKFGRICCEEAQNNCYREKIWNARCRTSRQHWMRKSSFRIRLSARNVWSRTCEGSKD